MQQGSTALTLLVALTSVSASFIYIKNSVTLQKQDIDKAALNSGRELNEISDINTLARFRSLIDIKKIDDGVYEPAIYPTNYFETEWKLNPNSTITDQVDKKKIKIEVLGKDVKFSEASSGTSYNDLAYVLKNEPSAASTATVGKTISIKKANFDDDVERFLATSVDVEVVAKDKRRVNARIPLKAPVPYNPILELRKVGSPAWTTNFSQMDPGDYELRVLGSGVVLAAELTVNGKTKILGFDSNGKINHKAVNIRAVNQEIGRYVDTFLSGDESFDFDRPNCMLIPLDGVFNYELRLIGADGKPQAQGTAGQISMKSKPSGPVLTSEQFKATCNEECPYIEALEEAEVANPARQVRSGNFTDYSWINNKDWTSTHVENLTFKICENIRNVFANSEVRNMPYMTMSDKEIQTHLWANDTQRFNQYLAYKEPDCKPRPLFIRGACGCFATGTRIRLEDGSEKAIDQLQGTERVWNPVTKAGQAIRHMTRGPEKLPLFRIESQGRNVLVTGTHPFVTRKGIVPAFQLEEGNEIQSVAGAWERVDAIRMEEPTDDPPIVWNLELEGPNDDADSHFVEANGLVTGDLLLQTQLQGNSGSR